MNFENAVICPECNQKSLPRVKKNEICVVAVECQNTNCKAIIEVQINPQFGVQYGKCVGHWRKDD